MVLAALTEANVTGKTSQVWLLLKERAAKAAPAAWLSFAGRQAMKQQATELQLQATENELGAVRKQLLHQSGCATHARARARVRAKVRDKGRRRPSS